MRIRGMYEAEALDIVGGLSSVTKAGGMKRSWASWGIPAAFCPRGSVLKKISCTACSVCYADGRGNYRFTNVQNAQFRRLEALENPRWVDAMIVLVRQWEYFRWFDSGDVQDERHLDKILAVSATCKDTKFWMPTHEPYIVGYLRDDVPDNMCIRISADLIEDRPRTPTWGFNTSTIHTHKGEPVPAPSGLRKHSIECKASTVKGGKCGSCRACFNRRVYNVSYLLHR